MQIFISYYQGHYIHFLKYTIILPETLRKLKPGKRKTQNHHHQPMIGNSNQYIVYLRSLPPKVTRDNNECKRYARLKCIAMISSSFTCINCGCDFDFSNNDFWLDKYSNLQQYVLTQSQLWIKNKSRPVLPCIPLLTLSFFCKFYLFYILTEKVFYLCEGGHYPHELLVPKILSNVKAILWK